MNLRQSETLKEQPDTAGAEAAAPNGDRALFTEDELNTIATTLMQVGGPNLFWSKIDIYLPGAPGEQQPSALYWGIKLEHPNSAMKEHILETLRLLHVRSNWSRTAFGRALVAANRCPLASSLGIRSNAQTDVPVTTPALISDNAPLIFDECLKLATQLQQQDGPSSFICKADAQFRTNPRGEPISDLWDQIKVSMRSSIQMDQLIELCMRLSKLDNWSRALLGRALVSANRTPLARSMGLLNVAPAAELAPTVRLFVPTPAAASPAPNAVKDHYRVDMT